MGTRSGARTRWRLVSVAAALSCVAGVQALAQDDPPPYPACEPRRTTDPARLNILGQGDAFGLVPPCRSQLVFYIAQTTDLRVIDGQVRFVGADGQTSDAHDVVVTVTGPTGGQFRGAVALPPEAESRCARLTLTLDVTACRDGLSQLIACPAIRLLREHPFQDVVVRGDDMEICADGAP
ncbi:hypothetical protein [Rhodophyticola sp.]|uniref:hypothetical protein n=1 Tax=Rhodophyticola sp. TaxID=2680032 RepID=UPI003D28BA4A